VKIGGKKVEALAKGEVVLPRSGDGQELRLQVRAFPLGSEEEAAKLFPTPVPPVKFATGKRGKPLRDPETHQVVKVRDLQDPDFVRESRLANRRQMIFLIVEGLKEDPTLEWDTPRPEELTRANAGEYFDAVFAECQEAGLSTGDLGLILDKIRELGNLTGAQIDEAVEDFLSEEQAV